MTDSLQTLRADIDNGPMSRVQIGTVLTCLAINLIDGFDVLSISFAASSLAQEWALAPDELGILFSASVAGMTIASIFLSPIADYIGRRSTVLLSLCAITLGMLAAAMAQDATQLAIYRFITGLGIGALLPSINTMVAEFSSKARREQAVTVMQAGFPLGATLGGFAAFALIESYGWRGIFWVGAILSGLLIPLTWKFLPESPDFLISRQPNNALEKLNAVLERIGKTPLAEIPESAKATQGAISSLTEPKQRLNTAALSFAFFFTMAAYYFIASWTPKLLTDAGLSNAGGISGGVLLSLAGVVGGLVLGWLSRRLSARYLTCIYMGGAVVTMLAFTQISDLNMMLLGGVFVGFFVLGTMIGLYSVAPGLFPAESRSTATGIALGMGRFGAVLGPMLTGILLASDWQVGSLYALFAAPLVLTAVVLFWLAKQEQSPKSV